MSRSTKSYSNKFKNEAVKLVLSSGSVSSAARDLGVPLATMHIWVAKAKHSGEV